MYWLYLPTYLPIYLSLCIPSKHPTVKHPPNQQKPTGIIRRTPNHILQEKQKSERDNWGYAYWKWQKFKNSIFPLEHKGYHSVHPPFCWRGRGVWTSYQIFKKEGFDRTSTVRGGCWKRGGNFFQGELQLLQKKKKKKNLKYSMAKKVYN